MGEGSPERRRGVAGGRGAQCAAGAAAGTGRQGGRGDTGACTAVAAHSGSGIVGYKMITCARWVGVGEKWCGFLRGFLRGFLPWIFLRLSLQQEGYVGVK